MKIARVTGTVVATISSDFFDGRTLLLCEYLTLDGNLEGGYTIAVDAVGAGVGQTVLLVDEGNSARQIVGSANAPVRTVVAGIVDAVEVDD